MRALLAICLLGAVGLAVGTAGEGGCAHSKDFDGIYTVAPGGDGVAYNGAYTNGGQIPAKAFDGDLSTEWNAGSGGNAESGWNVDNWVIFSTSYSVSVTSLSFAAAGDTTHDPKTLILSAGDSATGPWTIILTGTPIAATSAWQTFDVTGSTPAKQSYFKLEFPTRFSQYQAWIREIKLEICVDAPPPPPPSYPTYTTAAPSYPSYTKSYDTTAAPTYPSYTKNYDTTSAPDYTKHYDEPTTSAYVKPPPPPPPPTYTQPTTSAYVKPPPPPPPPTYTQPTTSSYVKPPPPPPPPTYTQPTTSSYVKPPPPTCNTPYDFDGTYAPIQGGDGVAYNGAWVQGGQTPDKLFDGDLTTRWDAGTGANAESGWAVDNWVIFTTSKPITAVGFAFSSQGDVTHDASSWIVSASDNGTGPFTQIGAGAATSGSDAWQTYEFNNVDWNTPHKYYKLEFPLPRTTPQGYQVWINEVKLQTCVAPTKSPAPYDVYHAPPPPPPTTTAATTKSYNSPPTYAPPTYAPPTTKSYNTYDAPKPEVCPVAGTSDTWTSNGKTWTKVFHGVTGKSFLLDPHTQLRAQLSSSIRICAPDGRFVESKPETFPIKQLRDGQTVSFPRTSDNLGLYSSAAVIASTWTGPADLLARMNNSCGSANTISDRIYWSCNNGNGLHILSDSGIIVEWDWSQRAVSPHAELSVWVDQKGEIEPCPVDGTSDTWKSNGKTWTKVFHGVTGKSFLLDPDTQLRAQKSSSIRICSPDGRFVESKPETFPIKQLRAGQTISFPRASDNLGTFSSAAVVASTWTGPDDLLAHMWNSCGSADSITDRIYWACNNGNGLHILSDSGIIVEWDWAQRAVAPHAELSVWVDQQGDIDGCPVDNAYAPVNTWKSGGKTWTKFFHGQTNKTYSIDVADVKGLASHGTQIRICDGSRRFVTSKPETFPIKNLRNGLTISYPTTNPVTYSTPAIVAATWEGDDDLLPHLWNSCGAASDVTGATTGVLYWACNNQNGLHLVGNSGVVVEWDWSQRTTAPHAVLSAWVDSTSSYSAYTAPVAKLIEEKAAQNDEDHELD